MRLPKKAKALSIISVLVILTVGIFGTYILQRTNHTTPTSTLKQPTFYFDETAARNWWSGGGSTLSEQDKKDSVPIDDEPLPTSSITVFEGKKNEYGDKCFVMAFYGKETINDSAVLQKRVAGLKGSDNLNIQSVGTPSLKMKTPEGEKEYTLNQYDIVTNAKVQRGNAFGFVVLKSGHIEVRAICPTAEQLSTTLVPLSALRLEPS